MTFHILVKNLSSFCVWENLGQHFYSFVLSILNRAHTQQMVNRKFISHRLIHVAGECEKYFLPMVKQNLSDHFLLSIFHIWSGEWKPHCPTHMGNPCVFADVSAITHDSHITSYVYFSKSIKIWLEILNQKSTENLRENSLTLNSSIYNLVGWKLTIGNLSKLGVLFTLCKELGSASTAIQRRALVVGCNQIIISYPFKGGRNITWKKFNGKMKN